MEDPQVRSLRRYVEVRNWWSLVLKEWRVSARILLASAATLGFDAWLAVKAPAWEMNRGEGLAFVLSLIPFVGICIASLIVGYLTMRNDWRDRAELQLPSSPMGGAGSSGPSWLQPLSVWRSSLPQQPREHGLWREGLQYSTPPLRQ